MTVKTWCPFHRCYHEAPACTRHELMAHGAIDPAPEQEPQVEQVPSKFEGAHDGCGYLAGKTETGALFCNKCGFYSGVEQPEPVGWACPVDLELLHAHTVPAISLSGMGQEAKDDVPLYTAPPEPTDRMRKALEEVAAKLIEARAESMHGKTANPAYIDMIVEVALKIARTALEEKPE